MFRNETLEIIESTLYPFDFINLIQGLIWTFMIFCWGWVVCSYVARRPKKLVALYYPVGLAASIFVLTCGSFVTSLPLIGLFAWLWGIVGLLLFFFGKRWRNCSAKHSFSVFSDELKSFAKPNESLLKLLGLLFFFSSFIVLFEFQHYFDVLSYHLPLAHELARGSGFWLDGYDYYQSLPFGAFLLYVPVLSSIESSIFDPGVGPILWFAWLNCCYLAARICGQFGARRWVQNSAFLMVAIYPSLWKAWYLTQTDTLTALFVLAGFERLISALKTKDLITLLLAGFLIGTTYSIKQSALAIYIIPALIFIFATAVSASKEMKFKWVLVPSITLIIGMMPWLIRSVMLAGNPFFPLFGTHELWTANQQEFLLSNHSRVSPFSLEYFGNLLKNIQVFGYSLQMLTPNGIATLLPPIGIIAIAGIALLKKQKFTLSISYLFILSGYGALCLVGLAPQRFGLGLSIISICLGLVILSKLFAKRVMYAAIPIGLLILSVLSIYSYTYIEGWKSEVWNPEVHFPMQVVEAQRSTKVYGSTTWVLFETRERFFSDPTISGKVWNPMPYTEELKASNSPEEFRQKLVESGVTQIVVNDQELGRLVDFYGDETETNPAQWAAVGVLSDQEVYAQRLAQYPPTTFSNLSEKDCLLLAEFLRQTFFQANDRLLLYRPEPDQFGRPVAFAAIWVAHLN